MMAHAGDPIILAGHAGGDPLSALANRLESLPRAVLQPQRMPLGTYHGLRFGMVFSPQWRPEVYLEGKVTRHDTLSREHQGPRAVLNAVQRLARGYAAEAARVQQDLGIAQAQLRDYQARSGQPFAHDAYLSQLTGLRDQLKAGLSGTAPQDGQPTAAELAERIKALRAAHTVEATPERTGKRRSQAKEPVTARIRRRAETAATPGPDEPEITHRDRLARQAAAASVLEHY